MQQSCAAEVRILIENLYKFKVFRRRKLIREFSEKVEMQKLRDSGSMTRRTGSGRRRSVRSDASLVFTRYSTNI